MASASFPDFLQLGLEHIFTGYDHLVFLFGLLLTCTRWRDLVSVVTAFTLGHSLTLALAASSLVTLPTGLVEPLIAGTIFAVGLENFRRDERSLATRGTLAVLFGLIHGFGFANVLREAGAGRPGSHFVASLLGFNLGVEVGQLLFAALMVPLFRWFQTKPGFEKRCVPVAAALVAVVGLYWLIERTFLA